MDVRKLTVLRICNEANDSDRACNNSSNDDPKGRFFIVHNALDPFFHACLTKGKRAGGDPAAVDTAVKKCGGVSTHFILLHMLDDLLIASCFNIPAQQNISKPKHRVEPVNAQQKKSDRLPPVILALDMCLLMGDHIYHIGICDRIRQIDPWLYEA